MDLDAEQQTAREHDESLSENPPREKNNALEDYGYLLMRLGRYMAVLFFGASALLVYITDDIVNALIVLLALALSLLMLSYTEHFQRELMGIDKISALRLGHSSFVGPSWRNILYFPSWIRSGPIVLSTLGAIAFTIFAAIRAESFYEIILGIVTFFCATMTLGIGSVIVVAFGNGVVHLKQQDIDCINIEKFGIAAAANYLYADKSLFQNDKNPDINTVFTDGEFKSISALSYDAHAPLIFGFNLCDNGELGKAFGYANKIGDGLMRMMRTTPLEHRALFRFKTYSYKGYTEEDGFAAVTYLSHKGEILRCVAGKPERLFPHLTKTLTTLGLRDIDQSDLKRLGRTLEQIYTSGKQAVMVADGAVGEDLAFMGYIILSAQISENAEEAIAKLKSEGMDIMYVSDENVALAYHKANSLGITTEISRILTGSRIENFRTENLSRAAAHATLAAEMGPKHRKTLAKIHKSQGRILLSASGKKDDGVFECADVAVGTEANEEYAVDISVKSPKITDIAELSKTVKIASSAAKRAYHNLMFAPLGLSASMLLCVLFTGFIPFYISAAVLLIIFIPLFQTLNIAASKEGLTKTTYFTTDSHYLFGKLGNDAKLPRRELGIWLVFASMFAAISSSYIFTKYYPVTSLGMPAASCAAFLALFLCAMANGLIMSIWGQPFIFVFSESKRKLLIMTAAIVAVVIALLRVKSICQVFRFDLVPYKQIPLTFFPAIITVVTYSIFSFINRRAKEKQRHAENRM